MVTSFPASPIDQIHSLLNELIHETVDLPDERKEQVHATLQKIRSTIDIIISKQIEYPNIYPSQNTQQKLVTLARLPDENPNPVARISFDGKILYCNRASTEQSSWAFHLGASVQEPFFSLLAEANSTGKQLERDIQIGNAFYSVTLMPYLNDRYVNLYGLDITRRKRDEAQMIFQAGLLSRVHDAIIATDDQSRIIYWNTMAEQVFGWREPEVIGKKVPELLQSQYPNNLREQAIKQLMETGHYEGDIVYHRKDGTTLIANARTATLKDPEDRFIGFVSSMSDITKRKRSEEALRESDRQQREMAKALAEDRNRLSAILDHLPVGVWITNSEGRIIGKNEQADRIWAGTAPLVANIDQYNKYPSWDAQSGKEIEKDEFPLARVLATGQPVGPLEQRISRFDGSEGYVLVSAAPILDAENHLAGAVAINMDITERKHAEEARKESEARERARANELEALMDAAPAVIWISRDPECREMTGNRFSYDFLSIRQGENVSKTAPDKDLNAQRYHMEKDGRPIPASELPMQIAAATGKPAKDYAFELHYQDGRVFHMFGNVNPLFDEYGSPYGAIGVFVDYTTLHRLEAEQIRAKAEIEVQRRLMDQREQERQAIARDLHDGPIQTLSSTVFHLQMIKEIFPDQALQVELNQVGMNIKNSIHEIRQVINDLRPPALMHFGLSRMIQMYTEDLRERFPGIEIILDIMDDERRLSNEACLALFRIYQAAINNIVRHSGASKAWVVYRIEHEAFYLELRDNGKGFEISPDFTQLTRDGHFGLVGMKERAEAIGGEFSVSSESGKGTTIVANGPLSARNLK